ncbi:DMT family transporter [Streptomyces sp. NPDC051180]|uniref:DMT family transporter n=1 Tax=Streptomyces sp. NPDC051180 TaxID=3155797 RepID=UPI00345049EC
MSPAAGTVVAVLLSLVSAAGYALAAVAQSRLAAASPAPDDGRSALRALLTRGQWWSAVGLNAAGALAHVAALHYGPLTLVQPLGALTLVAALPLGAHLAHRRVTRTEWRGALLTLGGLVGLVAMTGPTAPGEALSLRESLAVAAATALLIAALASGRFTGRGASGTGGRSGRGLGHATASGIASGVASALTQTLTAALALELPGDEPVWWQTAVLAVLISAFATGGLLLSQAAYRGGLAAPLAVVNLSNPAAAAVIGVALLGETFRAGAWGWLVAAAASLVAARGVVLLTKGGPTEAGTEPESAPGTEAGAAVDASTGARATTTAVTPSPVPAEALPPVAAPLTVSVGASAPLSVALAAPAPAPAHAVATLDAVPSPGAGPDGVAGPVVIPAPAQSLPVSSVPPHMACP